MFENPNNKFHCNDNQVINSICLSDEQFRELKECIAENGILFNKKLLCISEASSVFGIGQNKITELARNPRSDFVLYIGRKRLIKREEFERFLSKQTEI